MTRPATRTQAEIVRAIRAAEQCGKVARMRPDGTFEFVEKQPEAANTTPATPVEASPGIRL